MPNENQPSCLNMFCSIGFAATGAILGGVYLSANKVAEIVCADNQTIDNPWITAEGVVAGATVGIASYGALLLAGGCCVLGATSVAACCCALNSESSNYSPFG